MNSAAYHREYWRKHAATFNARRRQRYANRVSSKFWLYWLLDTLEFPPEPEYIVPVPSPVRRPLLRLRK